MSAKIRFEIDKAVLAQDKVPMNMKRVIKSALADLNSTLREIEREYRFDDIDKDK